MIPIKDIDQHLIMNIFNKMKNIPLCRMRRTCKEIDHFAEKNRKKLASRAFDGLDLTISTKDTYWHTMYEDFVIRSSKGSATPIADFNFEKQLSSISINKLNIENFPRFGDKVYLLLDNLKFFPVVESAKLTYMKTEFILQISDVIQVRTSFTLTGFLGEERPEDVIDNLIKSSKLSSFRLLNGNRGVFEIQGLFDKIKNFSECSFNCEEFQATRFLKEMLKSSDLGVTKRITFLFTDTTHWPKCCYSVEGVYPTMLWQPRFQWGVTSALKGKGLHVPLSVRYTRVNDKYAVIFENECYSSRYEIEVAFVDELSDIWPCVFRTFEIDSDNLPDFLETREEDRDSKMGKLFTDAMGSRGWKDEEPSPNVGAQDDEWPESDRDDEWWPYDSRHR